MIELFNKDCFDAMAGIKDKSIDCVITDPPYMFENQGGGFFAGNKSTKRKYLDSLQQIKCCEFEPVKLLELVKQKTKLFYGYFFCNKTLVDAYIKFAKDNNYQYDILALAKQNPIPANNNHHLSDLEYIVMIREKGTYFSKHKSVDDYRKFYITKCKHGAHPAEKPVELIQRFIRVSTQNNDTVLDCFMGSGTTGVACAKEGRDFIGIEIDPDYFRLAERRINAELDTNYLPLE